MALISIEYCSVCEKQTNHCNRKCSPCEARKDRERIAIWNSKTTDEKLQDLRARVERLEAGPGVY